MDEANEMDGETTIIVKSRVIEEILIGRTRDDENYVKYKGEVASENAVLDAQLLFPQSSNVSPKLHTNICTTKDTSKIQQVVEISSFQ